MLKKVIDFIKNPERPESYQPISAKDFFTLLGLVLVVIIPYAFLLEKLDVGQFDNALEELLENYKWFVVAGVIVLAPLIEEPIFRLHLDYKKSSIYWGMGLSILVISEFWFISLAFLGYLFFLLMKIKDDQPPKLKLIVFMSAGFFGLVHLGNYTGFDWVGKFYYVPLLVGAQFVLGLVLSYVRINHGIRAAMLFHGTYNALILIPAAIFGEI
ncbi:type II CAAX prenyl endopeptidase Rce1 family protein [Algoriphagus namhaensis]|uniref:Type II CAAX prenyl endopeptidase Rce1 family protein n=1 Tax=Algoriphagus namhaensis TaxID=915353 RepID=A0ABV8AQR2_9BACT